MINFDAILSNITTLLTSGHSPVEVADYLNIPLSWITETEMDMSWTDYPVEQFFGAEK